MTARHDRSPEGQGVFFETTPPSESMRQFLREVTYQADPPIPLPREIAAAIEPIETRVYLTVACPVDGCEGVVRVDSAVAGPAPWRFSGVRCSKCSQTYTIECDERAALPDHSAGSGKVDEDVW